MMVRLDSWPLGRKSVFRFAMKNLVCYFLLSILLLSILSCNSPTDQVYTGIMIVTPATQIGVADTVRFNITNHFPDTVKLLECPLSVYYHLEAYVAERWTTLYPPPGWWGCTAELTVLIPPNHGISIQVPLTAFQNIRPGLHRLVCFYTYQSDDLTKSYSNSFLIEDYQ